MRRLLAVALAAVLLLTLSGSVLAAKGGVANGAGNDSAVWIVELGTLAPTSGLHLGDSFTVGYSTRTQEPWALAQCFPNSSTVEAASPYEDGSVWGEWFSLYPGGPAPQDFVLGASVSPIWIGGGADCTIGLYKLSGRYDGRLGFSNQVLLASASFVVEP